MYHGFYGVRIDGSDKLAFSGGNNSTPLTMGLKLVNELAGVIDRLGYADAINRWRRQASDLVIVSDCEPMAYASIITILSKGRCSTLRTNQLVLDSHICEWGYILNLDTELFEVYRGYQTGPHSAGRYADIPLIDGSSEFYPCALLFEIPLPDIHEFDPRRYLLPTS